MHAPSCPAPPTLLAHSSCKLSSSKSLSLGTAHDEKEPLPLRSIVGPDGWLNINLDPLRGLEKSNS
eukprot:1146939-Pelagomonas_calceolata.AAC.7